MKRMRNWVLVLIGLVMIGSSFQSLAAEQTVRDVSRENGAGLISTQSVDEPSKKVRLIWNGKDNNITACAEISIKQKGNISITMKLQKLSGKAWSPVKTWTGSHYGTLGVLEKPYTLTSGGTYRVYATFQVNGTTYTATSNEIKYLDNTYIQSMDSYE